MEGEGKKGRAAITMTIWRNDRAQLDTLADEHIHQWQDCCLWSDEYRPNGYSDGTL